MSSFFIFVLLRIAPVFEILKNSYKIPGLSFPRKWDIFIEYVFQTFCDINTAEQLLIIILSILTALNIVLFVIFAKRQRKMLSKRSLAASLSGMVLGLFGVGCLSCGVLILAPLLTFLGLGAYLGNFAEYAVTISYVGMVLVILSSLYLLKKISEPLICES